MKNCAVVGINWGDKGKGCIRFLQHDRKELHEVVCCRVHAASASYVLYLKEPPANTMRLTGKEDVLWRAY